VPANVFNLSILAVGASGGDGYYQPICPGGRGGWINATIAVTPGQVLYIFVGGKGSQSPFSVNTNSGGFNGGGNVSQIEEGLTPCIS